MPGRYEARIVVQDAREALAEVRRLEPSYASARGPLGETRLVRLLERVGVGVSRFRFRSARAAFLLRIQAPEVAVNAALPRRLREFALRHELYHVLADDVATSGGPLCCGDPARLMTPAERAADLFALADVLPTPRLRAYACPLTSAHEVVRPLSAYWPEPIAWASDRVVLRMLLWAADQRRVVRA